MRTIFLVFTLFYLSILSLFSQETPSENETNVAFSDLLDTSFFGDVLENVKGEQDAMGTQRIIDMEEGIFSPSLSFTTSYNYSSNPLKAEDNSGSALDDGFTANFNLAFNLGIGD